MEDCFKEKWDRMMKLIKSTMELKQKGGRENIKEEEMKKYEEMLKKKEKKWKKNHPDFQIDIEERIKIEREKVKSCEKEMLKGKK